MFFHLLSFHLSVSIFTANNASVSIYTANNVYYKKKGVNIRGGVILCYKSTVDISTWWVASYLY